MRTSTKKGKGRHAIRVLDEAFEYESTTIAIDAAGEVLKMEAHDNMQLGKYITGMKLHTQSLENTGHPLPLLFI